uniref:cytochrome c oxidase subunit II n=1 Tax=Parachordodes pustulosus TaxID=3049253 RepID=UPI002E7AA0E7|nr:cytochrome c oxidase subunit II [Parachordodes pustulosus]WQH58890.1 cytochrome c oxidase subunit II [Parachordodes pustulosus]
MNPWRSLFLQDMLSSTSEYLLILHEFAMTFITGITIMVFYMFTTIFLSRHITLKSPHTNLMEFLWTLSPMLILLSMAFPTIKILYSNEDMHWPDLTIKVMGAQWYWNYEYSDFENINFDSFMSQPSETSDFPRLLDTDNHLIIPYKIMTRFMVSSNDVLHSFSLPQFSLKMDAVPGRLNQIFLMPKKSMLSYGQCSEICGVNHSFMPICLESININDFMNWIKNK